MRAETEKKLQRINRVSRTLKRACLVCMVLTAFVLVLSVVCILSGRGVAVSALGVALRPDAGVSAFGTEIPLEPLTVIGRSILAAIIALMMAIELKTLTHLHRLFGYYSKGNVFTLEAAGQIRQLGITAVMWVVPQILWIAAYFVLIRPGAPESMHLDLAPVVLGMVIMTISWFMDAAAELREENELTI